MVNLNINQSSASQGAGIDVTSVVDQIIYAEQAPERLWQQQQAALQTQATVLNALTSSMSALQDKIFALKDFTGALTAKTVSSSQPNLVTASAQSGASDGVHTLVVQNLATVSSYYTDAVASSSTAFTQGSFSLQVGSTTHTITVDDTNNTLDKLAAYINGQDFGVQASVVNDANGARLALVSKTTGAPGDLTISANTTGLNFQKSVTGKNANFTMDGVPLSSSSNTVTSVLPGVTLSLLGEAPTTPVTLQIAPDTTQAAQAIQNFVTAYNAVIQSVGKQFAVNSATSSAGPLAGDSSLRALQSSLLGDVTYSITGNNGFVNLASLGVDMANDGTLSVNTSKLNSALSTHFDDVKNFFQSATQSGFAINFSADLARVASPSSGLLALSLSSNAANQKMLADHISDFEGRLAVRRQQLTTEYSRVDAMLRQYPLLVQQLQSQLATTSSSK